MKSVAQFSLSLFLSVWVSVVQPGLSYFWLIDPDVHAEIDAEEYGQTPDGRMLPGHPWHPPHDHPSSAGLSITDLVQQNAFDAAFYATVFSPAERPALQDRLLEVEMLVKSSDMPPPDQPPRA
jgi:hypothetical protein